MTEHVSDLMWDRLLAGELAADQRDVAHVHAESCAHCGARLRELTAEREAFKLRPVGFPLVAPRRRKWWTWAPLVPVLAAVAIFVVVRTRPPEQPDQIDRPKGGGGVSLLLSVGAPGALAAVSSGDAIRPGDYLQAGYTTQRDGYGAVLSRDPVRAVTTYVPSSGDVMVSLPAGTERSFPQSTILDDVVGSERIVIVWCETAHPLAALLAELRDHGAIEPPADCTVRTVDLDKRVGAR